ncbi:MAG: hypothetical protein NTW79_03220 [Candidatus Berkelbacteria bacterium]|nr:hypothetical protein [Candidatus Berkelbacteria bacterium]
MKCSHQKSDGGKCQSNAMTGSDFCFVHDPTMKQKHLKATKKGGQSTHSKDYVKLDLIPIEDASSALYLISDTIDRIRTAKPDGTLDLKVANSIGFLTGKLLECKKQLLYEEDLLKNAICKDQKIDLATFRKLMQKYDKEFAENMGDFITGVEERYAEHKRTKDPAYMF